MWRFSLQNLARKLNQKKDELLEFIVQYGDASIVLNFRIAAQTVLTIDASQFRSLAATDHTGH